MGSKGSSSSQSSSTQTYTPRELAGLQDIFSTVQNTAKTPYAPYNPQDVVAPFNATQNTAISNIAGAQGIAQPYFNQAQQYAQQGAGPLLQTPDAVAQQLFGTNYGSLVPAQQQQVNAKQSEPITRYENPFQQQVIQSTMANMAQQNAEQFNQLRGNSASQGGLGNERFYAAAIPQLARQQSLANNQTLAGLNAQNYTQALAQAQADRAAAGQGAFTEANLGTGSQGAQIAGSQAALQAGTAQQQNEQQLRNAQLQEFMRKQGYPFDVAKFYATLGIPAATAQGGTTAGTSQTSGQSESGGGFGGALSLLGGLFGADGGRINYAVGGGVDSNVNPYESYVPTKFDPIPISFPHFPSMPGHSGGGQGGGQDPAKQGQQLAKMLKGMGQKTTNPFEQAQQGEEPGQVGSGGPQSDNSPLGDKDPYSVDWNEAAPVGGGDPFMNGSGSMDLGGMDSMGGMGDMFQGSDMGGDFGGGDFGGGDFMGDIGMFAKGGEVKPKTTEGGVPLMVDGLIQTAHKIKEGLHKMPKRQHYDKGGSVQPGLGGQILDFIDPTRIYNRLNAPHVPTVADDQQYILTQGPMAVGVPTYEDTGNPFAGTGEWPKPNLSPDAQGDIPRLPERVSASHPVMARPRARSQMGAGAYNQLAQQNAEGSVSQWQPYPFEGGNVISLPEARGTTEAVPQRVTERAPEREVAERREAREPMSLYERTRQILTGPALLPLDANEGKKGLFARMQGPTGYSRSADLHARQLLAHAAQVDMAGGNSKYQWYPSKGKDENGNLVDGAIRVPTTGNGAPQFFPNVTMLPRSAGHSSQPDDTLWNRATGFAQRDAEANMSLIGKPVPEREKYIAQRTQYHFDEAKKRQSSGKAPFAGDNVPVPAVAAPSGIPTISSKEERDKLPAGTKYIGPDGKQYIKQ